MKRLFAIALLALSACSSGEPAVPTQMALAKGTLTVRRVEWKPATLNIGRVVSVSELSGATIAFGDAGVFVFVGGVLAAQDRTTGWLSSAVVQSAAGEGEWLIGVDGKGHLYRVGLDAALDEVGDRYGVEEKKLRRVLRLSVASVALEYEGGFAIASGATATVEQYADPAFKQIVGGYGRLAAILPSAVRVFELGSKTFHDYQVADAQGVAIDPAGRLFVATRDMLFRETITGQLDPVFRSKDRPLHGLAAGGDKRLWFSAGTELGALPTNSTDVQLTQGLALLDDARLQSSSDGDAWVLGGNDALRFTTDAELNIRERAWNEQVRPVFQSTCSQCHLPGGMGKIDFSTYQAWLAHIDEIEARVVVGKTMPPAGTEMADADRAKIAAWVQREKKL